MIWLFSFATGDSAVRGASKSFQERQGQFCGKRKMFFIPEVKCSCGRKEVPMSLPALASLEGRAPPGDWCRPKLTDSPHLQHPSGMRGRPIHQKVLPPSVAPSLRGQALDHPEFTKQVCAEGGKGLSQPSKASRIAAV